MSRSSAASASSRPATGQQAQVKANKPQLVVPTGHANSVNSLAFSPDGKLIASSGGERTIKVWGQTLLTLNPFSPSRSIRNVEVFIVDGLIKIEGLQGYHPIIVTRLSGKVAVMHFVSMG